jgi:hypothetical protein
MVDEMVSVKSQVAVFSVSGIQYLLVAVLPIFVELKITLLRWLMLQKWLLCSILQ